MKVEHNKLTYKGFSKLYNASGMQIGHVVVMYGEFIESYSDQYFFYSTKSGKYLCRTDWCPQKTTDFGLDYIHSFVNNMGEVYYIGPIEKTITIEI